MVSTDARPGHPPEAVSHAAFDLDGTLLDDTGAFLPRLPEALSRLRHLGVRPLLVTGRSLATFRALRVAEPVLATLGGELLLSDGNVWLDRVHGTCRVTRALPWETLDALAGFEVPDLVAEVDRVLVASSRRAATAFAMAYRLPRSGIVVDPGALRPSADPRQRDTRVLDAVTVFGRDVRALPPGALPPHELHLIRFLDGQVLRPHRTCKATALETFLRRRGDGTLRSVVAFGDGYNDGCLLGSAALGVAVRHADAVAVRHSDLLLDQPLDEFLLTFDPAGAAGSSAGAGPRDRPVCFGGHAHPGSAAP